MIGLPSSRRYARFLRTVVEATSVVPRRSTTTHSRSGQSMATAMLSIRGYDPLVAIDTIDRVTRLCRRLVP